MNNFFKKSYFPYLLLTIVTALVSCIIFDPALSLGTILNSPDSPTELGPFAKSQLLYSFYNFSPAAFSFDTIWKLIISPFHYGDLGYIIIAIFVALSTYHYLRVIKLDKMAAIIGAMAMTFSGYHFTLFSAGHRGYQIMMPYAILCFAIVEQVLSYGYKCRWYHFVMVASGAAVGLAYQPDIFLLFVGTLVVYAIARLCMQATANGWKAYFKTNGLQFVYSIIALLIFFAIVGTPSVRNIFENTLAGRQEQLEQSKSATTSETDPATGTAKEIDTNWIFATGWSLPPDELVELVVPSPYGFDTGNEKAPYIGELGRPHDWKPNSNSFANYRQHNLYLGMLQGGIALFVVILCFALFAKNKANAEEDCAKLDADAPNYEGIGLLWFAIILGTGILSLGRFTPIYALFYKLPVMDMIRCPVKFIHILELGVAVLVGIGIDVLLKHNDDKRVKIVGRFSMLLLIAIAGICFATGSNANSISTRLSETFNANQDYIKHFLPISIAQYKSAFSSAAWMAICGSVFIGLMTIKNPIIDSKLSRYILCIIILCGITWDMTKQAKNFVHTTNIDRVIAESVFIDAAKQKLGDKLEEGGAYSYLGLQTILPQISDFKALENKGYYCADPFATSNPKEKSVIAFQGSALANATTNIGLPKRWPLMGTQLYIATLDQAKAFMNTGLFDFVATYNFEPQLQVFVPVQPSTTSIYLLALKNLPCGLGVYYNYSTSDKPLDAIANPAFDVYKNVVISDTTNQLSNVSTKMPTQAKWIVKPSDTEYRSATIEATCEEENGLLYIRHNYLFNREFQATIDGKPAEMYVANAFYRAIPITKGTHTIEIKQNTPLANKLYILVIAFTTIAGFGFYIWNFCRSEKKETII